jgi:hypothetical protein
MVDLLGSANQRQPSNQPKLTEHYCGMLLYIISSQGEAAARVADPHVCTGLQATLQLVSW